MVKLVVNVNIMADAERRSMKNQLKEIAGHKNKQILIVLSPQPFSIPIRIQHYDDPVFPFGKQIIDATKDLVCGYIFDFCSYLGWGACGIIALERTLAYAMNDSFNIIHGSFANPRYLVMLDDGVFGADGITVSRLFIEKLDGELPIEYRVFAVDLDKPSHMMGIYDEANNVLYCPTRDEEANSYTVVSDSQMKLYRGEDYLERLRDYLLRV